MQSGRRHFLLALGGALSLLPVTARGQRRLPVIGFLHDANVESYVFTAQEFAQGLAEQGFAEAQNVAVEYRFANGDFERLSALAADLATHAPAVIIAGGGASTLAARASAPTTPVVSISGFDPALLGLTAEDATVAGVAFQTGGLMAPKLALLRQVVPTVARVGYLTREEAPPGRPDAVSRAVSGLTDEARAAAAKSDLDMIVAPVGRDRNYRSAFTHLIDSGAKALVVAPSPLFACDTEEIVSLTLEYELPAIFPRRADVVAAGLMSYGPNLSDAWRQAGSYAGRILRGAKAADLPPARADKLELIISRTIAKSLDLAVPASLFAQADEIID